MTTNKQNLEVEEMWVLSTAHLPEKEASFLTDNDRLPFYCLQREEGWFIPVTENVFEAPLHWWVTHLPWLFQILEDAKGLGFGWVLLDRDGPVTKERFGEDRHVLPVFDW